MSESRPVEGLFIDNETAAPASGEYFDVVDPVSGRCWVRAAAASAQDVERAVRSARRAFRGEWADYRAADRADFLIRFGQAVAEHAEELADLQVRENGKLMREMHG